MKSNVHVLSKYKRQKEKGSPLVNSVSQSLVVKGGADKSVLLLIKLSEMINKKNQAC